MSQQTLSIILTIVVIFPFCLWFIRNWVKVVNKKQYRWLNISVIASFVVAVILIIVMLVVLLV